MILCIMVGIGTVSTLLAFHISNGRVIFVDVGLVYLEFCLDGLIVDGFERRLVFHQVENPRSLVDWREEKAPLGSVLLAAPLEGHLH
jgi:hypothetical protein